MCAADRPPPLPRGFSLMELLVAMVVLALLAMLAWPSLQGAWQRARRADAVLALLQLQQQQARWRTDHPRYADAQELGIAGPSPDGHYRLAIAQPGPHGYQLEAHAHGPQQGDLACARFQLVQAGGDTRLQSFHADGALNPGPENRRCWGR